MGEDESVEGEQEENAGDYDIIPWDVIRIPAWLDEEAAELLQLPVGSSYFPEWKPDEVLRVDEHEIKASNGSRYWNALYMQDPTPDEGGLIKKKWLKWWEYDEPPPCDFIIQTYDTAFSTKTKELLKNIPEYSGFAINLSKH